MEMGRNLEAKQLELNLIKDSLGCLVHPKMLQIVPFSCKKVSTAAVGERMGKREKNWN